MCYTSLITSGIGIDCDFSVGKAVGVEKDLILGNYEDFKRELTLSEERESDDTNNNKDGLRRVEFKDATVLHTFKGKQNSVVPGFSAQELEDGRIVYTHSLNFTVFNKTSEARHNLMNLSSARLVAITVDKSTGLFEIFGIDRGLKLNNISREYVGSQSSNYFQVSLTTPSQAVLKETRIPELTSEIKIEGSNLELQGYLQYTL
jgi:hypothetical protein